MEPFYFVLPSTGSPLEHSSNTASQFQVTLNDPIQLTGEWEVGLEEITYAQTFQTITTAYYDLISPKPASAYAQVAMTPASAFVEHLDHPENDYFNMYFKSSQKDRSVHFVTKKHSEKLHFYITEPHGAALGFSAPKVPPEKPGMPYDQYECSYIGANHSRREMDYTNKYAPAQALPTSITPSIVALTTSNHKAHKAGPSHRFHLSSGFYPKPEELLPFLNMKPKLVEFGYNKARNRFFMIGRKEGYTINFGGDSDLQDILGFKERKFSFKAKDEMVEAKYAPSMFAGSHSFFIYCSICADMDVANVKVPLLRTVAIDMKANYGDVVNVEYKNPVYVPLRTNYIDSILVDIRNDMGSAIHFAEGKTQLVLRFRPRGSNK